jgi:hypothetical protein
MVQDTSESPEVYLASMPGSGTCGGWGLSDDASQREDVLENSPLDYSNLRERSVVWAVSVPGESQWVSEVRQRHPYIAPPYIEGNPSL